MRNTLNGELGRRWAEFPEFAVSWRPGVEEVVYLHARRLDGSPLGRGRELVVAGWLVEVEAG